MKANYSYASAIFNADFNNFANITGNQAWSLFFTNGQDDAALGDNPEAGKFFTNITIAVVAASILGSCIFTSI
ncbi:hypothetical protein [Floridanema aerugineum]|uniref:Uncharacterized protein n=1 Tax=Floridaenema aerugineum BLCC-F46 TaxID=3153654 RepID=A0ABV4WYI9_9CYAN